MTSTGKKMELNPAIIDQLEKGRLWTAAHQAGKLLVPGKAALTAVAGSIAKYTAALTGDPAQAPGANLFGFIREQLTRQKKVLG